MRLCSVSSAAAICIISSCCLVEFNATLLGQARALEKIFLFTIKINNASLLVFSRFYGGGGEWLPVHKGGQVLTVEN